MIETNSLNRIDSDNWSEELTITNEMGLILTNGIELILTSLLLLILTT